MGGRVFKQGAQCMQKQASEIIQRTKGLVLLGHKVRTESHRK